MGSDRVEWNTVVIQPTTFCNLNCSYCYLPDRRQTTAISRSILRSIVNTVSARSRHTLLLWHGGEPLATGKDRLREFFLMFEESRKAGLCTHSVQTNGTLIDDDWCDFFREFNCRIGVSIDGNDRHNSSRKNWAGIQTTDLAMQGIHALQRAKLPFGIIAVVNPSNLGEPVQMLQALMACQPAVINFNVEEAEGQNVQGTSFLSTEVDEFWKALLAEWLRAPRIPIRQFRDALSYISAIAHDGLPEFERNYYPTVDVNGDVYLLSPEFISVNWNERNRFVVGNVLSQDLDDIVQRGAGSWYVRDFLEGVQKCEEECGYFAFCRGGQASNKFFETGRLNVTTTRYCYNSRIAPVKALIDYVETGNEARTREVCLA